MPMKLGLTVTPLQLPTTASPTGYAVMDASKGEVA